MEVDYLPVLMCAAKEEIPAILRTLSIAFCCLSLADFTPAAVISRDWLALGDGLLTYDTTNRREWLDITVTEDSYSGNAVLQLVDELKPGGLFEAFSVASGDDVLMFATSAGIDTTTKNFARNSDAAIRLIGLLRNSEPADLGSSAGVFGRIAIFLDRVPPQFPSRYGASVTSYETTILPGELPGPASAGASVFPVDRAPAGTFLYRTVIPEPNCGQMLSLATAFSLLGRPCQRFGA